MHKKKKSVWKKILWLIRPYLHFLMLSFVFAVISALLTLYAPILIGNAVDLILGKGNGSRKVRGSDLEKFIESQKPAEPQGGAE